MILVQRMVVAKQEHSQAAKSPASANLFGNSFTKLAIEMQKRYPCIILNVKGRESMSPTRQDELNSVLNSLAEDVKIAKWISLVDGDGFVVASVSADMGDDQDRISAMAVAMVTTAERAINEIGGGRLRYINLAGSKSQNLIVILNDERLLSIGLPPNARPQSAFTPILKWIPKVVEVLNRKFTGS